MTPNMTNIKPDMTNIKPDMTNIKQDITDIKHDPIGMKSANALALTLAIAAAFMLAFALIFILTLSAFTISAATAVASESGAHEGGAQGSAMFWSVVNFLIIASVLYYFLNKPAKEYFSTRTRLIETSITEAREARALAQKTLDEMEDKLRLKDKEVLKIIETAAELGQKERERLIEDGRQLSLRIAATVEKNIQSEFKKAMDALREEAVDIAVGMAGKKAEEKITDQQQRKLTQESILKIGGLN
jgi:F-type H+-transporting ATPase subunit b